MCKILCKTITAKKKELKEMDKEATKAKKVDTSNINVGGVGHCERVMRPHVVAIAEQLNTELLQIYRQQSQTIVSK